MVTPAAQRGDGNISDLLLRFEERQHVGHTIISAPILAVIFSVTLFSTFVSQGLVSCSSYDFAKAHPVSQNVVVSPRNLDLMFLLCHTVEVPLSLVSL